MITVLTGVRWWHPSGGFRRGPLAWRAGRFIPVPHSPYPRGTRILSFPGRLAVPGFVDLHTHGCGGYPAASTDESLVARMAAAAAAHGTTGLLLTTISAPLPLLEGQLAAMARVAATAPNVLGIHLEGPFLNPVMRGAHPRAALLRPSPSVLNRLLAAAQGQVRMVTLAPELPGALPMIASLARRGIVPALGHSDADWNTCERAKRAGARHVVHLFNRTGGLDHKRPGLAWWALAQPEVTAELIPDGHHVHPEVLRFALRAKSPRGIAFVTDAMPAAGSRLSRFSFSGLRARVRGGVAVSHGHLAGSLLTMDEALRRLVRRFGVPLADALPSLSATPARVLGLPPSYGTLTPNAPANLLLFGDRHRNSLRGSILMISHGEIMDHSQGDNPGKRPSNHQTP